METKSSIGSLVVGVISIAALILSLVAVTQLSGVHKVTKTAFGATQGGYVQGEVYYNPYILVGGAQFGTNGSQLNQYIAGTCNPLFLGTSFAASSTAQFTCPVAGVKAGDRIWGDMPVGAGTNGSGAGSLSGGFVMVAAYATTTGIVGFTIQNDTGAATSSFPQATTSVEFFDTN